MKKITTILIAILVLVLIIVTAVWISTRPLKDVATTPRQQVDTPIVIIQGSITEPNFTGTRPIITGSSLLTVQANDYLEKSIATFKTLADVEVPKMREQFGNDAPPTHYSIDFEAMLVEGVNTQSLVLDGYIYTGGANGSSFYKVFTIKKDTSQIITLSNFVPKNKQDDFAEYIKNKILTEQEGIFPEEVKNLTFDSFENFSIDNQNVIIYFDKYEIGAGALGAVAFHVPLKDIQQFLVL